MKKINRFIIILLSIASLFLPSSLNSATKSFRIENKTKHRIRVRLFEREPIKRKSPFFTASRCKGDKHQIELSAEGDKHQIEMGLGNIRTLHTKCCVKPTIHVLWRGEKHWEPHPSRYLQFKNGKKLRCKGTVVVTGEGKNIEAHWKE